MVMARTAILPIPGQEKTISITATPPSSQPMDMPSRVIKGSTGAMDIGTMMMEIAGLSFLGFGAQPPTPEWGLMLNEGRQYIQTAPLMMVYPGLAIFIVVSVFNLWGDALRDVLDPRQS